MKEWAWFLWLTQEDRQHASETPRRRVGIRLAGVLAALAVVVASGVLVLAGT